MTLSLVAATMAIEQLANATGRSLGDIASHFDKGHLIGSFVFPS
jgi:hypothetical protein